MSWELEEEVEVLRAIYGDESVLVEEPGPDGAIARLFIDLQPRVEQGAALVSVTLRIDLPLGYPTDATPQTSVERSRGLGDTASAALLAAASRAVAEHGSQEVGCVSQLLDEVSESLDSANQETECNICLMACGPGEATVRPPCDHVFHAACIGHWAALRAAEAEKEAGDAAQATVNTRNALERDLAEAGARIAEASERLEDAQQRASRRERRVAVARAQLQKGYGSQNEADVMEPLSDQGDEDAEPPTLEQLSELLRQARSKLKNAESEDKKARARSADIASKLEGVQHTLEKQAASLAAAGLPCPVCREPIERRLLPDASKFPAVVCKPAKGSQASCKSLPSALQDQVRQEQRRMAQRLARQREHAAAFEAPKEQEASVPLGEDAAEGVSESSSAPQAAGSSAAHSSKGGAAHADRPARGGQKGNDDDRHARGGKKGNGEGAAKSSGSKGGAKGNGWSGHSGWGSGWDSGEWWTSGAGAAWDGGGEAQKGGGSDAGRRPGRWRGKDSAARGAT